MIDPGDERSRAAGAAPGFTDAVTFAWGDPGAELHGLARVALDGAGDASVLAVLYSGTAPAAALARGGIPAGAGADFAELALPGLRSSVRTPLRAWSVAFDGAEAGFDLEFEALGAPVEIDGAEPVARTGGMAGYEQLCRVHGSVRVEGRERRVHALGQRSHVRGEPDWSRLAAVRTVSAWLDDGTGLSVLAVRPAGAASHAAESAWAAVLDPAGSLHVDDPRLSTTYDAGGRQRRAGLELWVDPDTGTAHRASGEALCGSSLDLDGLRLDAAVFGWHAGGRRGVGRYDVLRPA